MELKVYLSFKDYQNRKCSYCKRFAVSEDVTVDFGLLLRSMRFLYGSNCIVQFLIVS